MTIEIGEDGEPKPVERDDAGKPKRKGTFDSARGKAARARHGKAKGKQRMSRVERLAEAEQERMLKDPKVPDYVKKDVVRDVLNRKRGTPVSAKEMGTLERVAKPVETSSSDDLMGLLRGLAGGNEEPALLAALRGMVQPVASYTCPPPPQPAGEAQPETPAHEPGQDENVEPSAAQEPPEQAGPHWAEGIEASSMLELAWKRALT